MSWDFLGKLTRPIGNFEEKVDNLIPGGTPIWRLRQKLAEGFHHESGLSNSQAIGIGALLGTGAAAAGGAFAGGAGAGASELGTAGAWGTGAGTGAETAGASMPAAVPESSSTLNNWGMTQTGPGEWTQTQGYTPPKPSFSMPQQQQQHRLPRHSVYDVSPTAAAPGSLSDANGNPLPPQQVALLQAIMERQQQQQQGG